MLTGVRKTPRIINLIDNAFIDAVTREKQATSSQVVVEYAESTARVLRQGTPALLKSEPLPCITTYTQFYVFSHDRAMVGEDIGNVLGFGSPGIAAKVKNACGACDEMELRDLFGNAMALPHVGAAMAAAISQLRDVFVPHDDGGHVLRD